MLVDSKVAFEVAYGKLWNSASKRLSFVVQIHQWCLELTAGSSEWGH